MKRKKLLRITALCLPLILLMTMPVSGQQQTGELTQSEESGTSYYNASEVEALIDELTCAAREAVEKVAGEAAKAAALAALERQAEAQAQAAYLQRMYSETKKAHTKNMIIAGLSCFVMGAVAGTAATLCIGGR